MDPVYISNKLRAQTSTAAFLEENATGTNVSYPERLTNIHLCGSCGPIHSRNRVIKPGTVSAARAVTLNKTDGVCAFWVFFPLLMRVKGQSATSKDIDRITSDRCRLHGGRGDGRDAEGLRPGGGSERDRQPPAGPASCALANCRPEVWIQNLPKKLEMLLFNLISVYVAGCL